LRDQHGRTQSKNGTTRPPIHSARQRRWQASLIRASCRKSDRYQAYPVRFGNASDTSILCLENGAIVQP
jgi:hypothetical protein